MNALAAVSHLGLVLLLIFLPLTLTLSPSHPPTLKGEEGGRRGHHSLLLPASFGFGFALPPSLPPPKLIGGIPPPRPTSWRPPATIALPCYRNSHTRSPARRTWKQTSVTSHPRSHPFQLANRRRKNSASGRQREPEH